MSWNKVGIIATAVLSTVSILTILAQNLVFHHELVVMVLQRQMSEATYNKRRCELKTNAGELPDWEKPLCEEWTKKEDEYSHLLDEALGLRL